MKRIRNGKIEITPGNFPKLREAMVELICLAIHNHDTVPEAAKALGVSKTTLYAWLEKGIFDDHDFLPTSVLAARLGRPWWLRRTGA